jgi:hypothetical protein
MSAILKRHCYHSNGDDVISVNNFQLLEDCSIYVVQFLSSNNKPLYKKLNLNHNFVIFQKLYWATLSLKAGGRKVIEHWRHKTPRGVWMHSLNPNLTVGNTIPCILESVLQSFHFFVLILMFWSRGNKRRRFFFFLNFVYMNFVETEVGSRR